MQNLHWWLLGGAILLLLLMVAVAWRSNSRASLVIAVTALCLVLVGATTTFFWTREPVPSATTSGSATPKALAGIDGLAAPAGTCGAAEPVLLDGPKLKVFKGDDFPEVSLLVGDEPAFGDLEPDGANEVAVEITCRPADGRVLLEHAFLVFSGKSGSPRFVGAVDARYQERIGRARVGMVDRVEITAATVTATELVWLAGDPECCPKGRAVSTWTVEGDVLVVQSTKECPNARCP